MIRTQVLAVKNNEFIGSNGAPVKFNKISFATPDGDIASLNTAFDIRRGEYVNLSYRASKDGKAILFVESVESK